MVVILRKDDPIRSDFYSQTVLFEGVGVNLRLIPNETNLNYFEKLDDAGFKFARVLVATPDPSLNALHFQNYVDMDDIFSQSPIATDATESSPSTAEQFFAELNRWSTRTVFCFVPPRSWLNVHGDLTGETALTGYANYVLSGLAWIRQYQISAELVEVFPEPDSRHGERFGYVSPKDLVAITHRLRDIAGKRNMLEPMIKILGPGLGSVLPIKQNQELWTESFVYARRALDIWSIHANENGTDVNIYNSGTLSARYLMDNCLRHTVTQMNAINIELGKYVTSFSTRARSFQKSMYRFSDQHGYVKNDDGTITPNLASESPEFALRVIENLINILNRGFQRTFYEVFTAWKLGGGNDSALYDGSGKPTMVLSALNCIMKALPLPGNIYSHSPKNRVQDRTLKTLITSTNADQFCFLLSRPVIPDALMGKLRLVIHHPLWDDNYEAYDLNIHSFPQPAMVSNTAMSMDEDGKIKTVKEVGLGVDLSQVYLEATMGLNTLTLFAKGLPYGGCILIITGKIKSKNPPPVYSGQTDSNLPSDPNLTRVVQRTIMQVPVNYGEPNFTDYTDGTIYYDSKDKLLKTCVNGVWISNKDLEWV
jgi:hypothetical protein